MKDLILQILGFGVLFMLAATLFAGTRYTIQVPSDIYTAPYDPNDPIYRYIEPPPADWAQQFGNNERTAIIQAISELRIIVAGQGKRLLALEAKLSPVDPNEDVQTRAVYYHPFHPGAYTCPMCYLDAPGDLCPGHFTQ